MVNNKNTNAQEPQKYEHIKQLNAYLQPGGNVSSISSELKDVKRRIDTLLNKYKEDERAKREAEAEDKRRRQEEEAAAAEKAQQKPIAPDELVKKEPAPAPATSEPEPAPAPEVTVAAEKPVETVKEQEAAEPAPAAPEPPKTPSYIRGVLEPEKRPVAPRQYNPSQSSRPPRAPRPPFGNAPGAPGAATGSRPMQPGGFNRNAPRPSTGTGGAAKPAAPIISTPGRGQKTHGDTKKKEYKTDDKRTMNKRTLIRKGFIQENLDEDRMGTRKLKNKKAKQQVFVAQQIEKAVITTENLTVKILSEKIGKTAQEIIKQLMQLGIMTNINSVVDFPTMELVANELGVELELKLEQSKEELLEAGHVADDKDEDLVKRPPIITVMGHVDHGKTSLLDAIRNTSVVTGEAGGITQHIGAYSVSVKNEKITFLDTPGHEAFTQMRQRGAEVTDIAILIVAADDGIMPQTIEAIAHAKAANVPIIVAVNKIDKPAANVDKIKQGLTEHGLVPEEWGGDVMVCPVSAKTGAGIDKLLENILFLAEYYNYRANPSRQARGTVVEAKLDKGKGPIANIIVMNGTLHVGDYLVSGVTGGRVRAMVDDKGRNIKEAGPSTPVSILGLGDVPNAGDPVFVVENEKMAKQVIDERQVKIQNEKIEQGQKITLDDVLLKTSEKQYKDMNVLIKADVQGSVEALKSSLQKLENDEVKVNVVFGGVGAVNRSDLMLAEVTGATIIGFNVRPDSETKAAAAASGIEIKLYKIIYEVLDDIERAMSGMLTPKFAANVIGHAQVRNVFKITGAGLVAGSYVTSGKVVRNAKVRVIRDGEVVHEGTISGLKRFKEDVKEVATGYECGINVSDFNDIKEGDELEVYVMDELK